MAGWAEFAAAFALFLTSHALPARPAVKAPLVRALGAGGYTLAYSLVSVAVLAWLIVAAARAPYVPLWHWAPWQPWVPFLLMLPACLLIVCAIGAPNPFSFGGRAEGFHPDRPGIAGLTRQPLLWALLLWAGAHLVPNGDLAHVLLFGSLAGFAALGMHMLDRRRQRLWGAEVWADRARATSLLPGAALLAGRWRPSAGPPVLRLAAGLALYGLLLGLHPPVIGASPWPQF
jgi:uncharacterized membrane protein